MKPITQTVKLGELTEIRTGKLDANAADENGEYPFFTCAKEISWINKYAYDTECVLVAGNGDLNVKYHNGKFNAYQRTYIIESADKSKLDVRYAYYFLSKYIDKLREGSIGGVIKYIRLGDLTEAKLSLPSLSVQKKIVEILDKADEIIKKRQEAIGKLDDLIQSVFLDMFGDPVSSKYEYGTIRDLVEEVKYGTSSKASTSGRYPYLRMNNITYTGYMDYSDLKYIDLDAEEVSKYTVQKGDLIFNRTNSKELVGKTGVYAEDSPMALAGYNIRVRTNTLANPYYIWGFLNSKFGKMTLQNMCKNIVGMANINAQELQDIKIPIPPISLQNEYEKIVLKILDEKEKLKIQENNIGELFEALSSDLFNDKLSFNN